MSDLNEYQIIQVKDLPIAQTLDGLNILGFDSTNNRAVRALMTLLKGLDGKPVELQKTATHLQWRVQGGTWANLLALDEVKGAKGDKLTYDDLTENDKQDITNRLGDNWIKEW